MPGKTSRSIRWVGEFVEHCNTERLPGAIGYVAPAAALEGRADAIRSERQLKLRAARATLERETRLTRKESKTTLPPHQPGANTRRGRRPHPLIVTCI